MLELRYKIDDSEVAAYLEGLEERQSSLGELLGILGEDVAGRLQGNIEDRGANLGVTWPDLHWLTKKVRVHYGHTADVPLIRDGSLLHSVRVLGTDDTSVLVGSLDPAAAITDEGGTVDGRVVPAFPWAALSTQDEEDLAEIAAEWLAGDD